MIPAEFFGGEPGTYIPIQFGTQYNGTAEVTLSQLILDGRYFLGLKATKALEDLSQKQVQQNQIEKKNHSLQNLVAEKEWLVREIHHRVKNNFHMVMGLLHTQAAYLQSDFLIERAALMQTWADFLVGLSAGGKVLVGHFANAA